MFFDFIVDQLLELVRRLVYRYFKRELPGERSKVQPASVAKRQEKKKGRAKEEKAEAKPAPRKRRRFPWFGLLAGTVTVVLILYLRRNISQRNRS